MTHYEIELANGNKYIIEAKVKFTKENYGADADGNRGMLITNVEYEIEEMELIEGIAEDGDEENIEKELDCLMENEESEIL